MTSMQPEATLISTRLTPMVGGVCAGATINLPSRTARPSRSVPAPDRTSPGSVNLHQQRLAQQRRGGQFPR